MKKILLSCATCLLAIGLVCACDEIPYIEEDLSEEETDLDEDVDEDKRNELTIWCPSEVLSSTEQLVSEFSEMYPEFDELYDICVEAVSEGDAATKAISNVQEVADIYFFAQDQLSRLIQVGGLSQVPASTVADVTSRNDDASVSAATSGSTLYAYPAAADNGYFVFYDKSVPGLDAEMTKEGGADQANLIQIAQTNSKTINFELTDSGWYLASYFIATGCESTWYTDESGAYINYTDTWNSDKGLTALQGAYELISSDVFINNSDVATAFPLINSNSMLVVSGTWDSTVAKNRLGSNLGVAPLWNFTVTGDDYNSVTKDQTETFHLGSYYGCKLVGVKPNSDGIKNAWAHLLANYLTDEHAQMTYYENLEWNPSNVKAQASEAVASDAVLAAFNEQAKYAVTQGQIPNDWWDITVTMGMSTASSGGTTEKLQAILDEYAASIAVILTIVPGDYAITGNLADEVTWSVKPVTGTSPYSLYEGNADTYSGDGKGKWTVSVTVVDGGSTVDSVAVGLFRICDWGYWTGNYGYTHLIGTIPTGVYQWNQDNNIAAVPGTYTLVFDTTGSTPAITMTSAS